MAAADLPSDQPVELRVGEVAIALVKVGGVVYALGNACAHRGGPLGRGYLDGKNLMCPLHGWAFDISTGECHDIPEARVPRYETRIEDGQILVRIA
jgi:nitrite reductase/ring-hydroxylating ferredoxin subunit